MKNKTEIPAQYEVYFTLTDNCTVCLKPLTTLVSARESLESYTAESGITNAILVRAKPPQVELGKGAVEPFKKGLDHNYPGWELVQTISE